MTVDKSEPRVRAMFAEIAGRYDFINRVLSAGTDVYWRRRTVWAVRRHLSSSAASGPLLDVCTGTGDLALAMKKAFPTAPVVAADFTHEMLVLAAAKAERRGRNGAWDGGVSWLEADTQALPFPDDAFTLVTVAFGLRNVTDADRGLREMARVCRPGGNVFVLEFSQPTLPLLGPLYGWYFRNVLPRIGQLLSRNRHGAYRYLPQSVGEFPDGRALCDRMEAAGLTDASFTPLTFGVATLYQAAKPLTEDARFQEPDAETEPREPRQVDLTTS